MVYDRRFQSLHISCEAGENEARGMPTDWLAVNCKLYGITRIRYTTMCITTSIRVYTYLECQYTLVTMM